MQRYSRTHPRSLGDLSRPSVAVTDSVLLLKVKPNFGWRTWCHEETCSLSPYNGIHAALCCRDTALWQQCCARRRYAWTAFAESVVGLACALDNYDCTLMLAVSGDCCHWNNLAMACPSFGSAGATSTKKSTGHFDLSMFQVTSLIFLFSQNATL
jgi:hypothetical protein